MRRELRAWFRSRLRRALRAPAPMPAMSATSMSAIGETSTNAIGEVCQECQRPIPPGLPPLPELVLGELDRHGATSAEQVARRLRRRTADVRAAFHELADAGLVRLEQPTASPRSRRWALVGHENGRGRAWDAHHLARGASVDQNGSPLRIGRERRAKVSASSITQSVFFAAHPPSRSRKAR
jgi:hypothetical protein